MPGCRTSRRPPWTPGLRALSALSIPDELTFVDRRSGTDAEREGLKAMLACARPAT
jgi:hypothetical protein